MKMMIPWFVLCVLAVEGCATVPNTREVHPPKVETAKPEGGAPRPDNQSAPAGRQYHKTPDGYYITDLSRIPGQPVASLHCDKPLMVADLSGTKTKAKKTMTQQVPVECRGIR